MRRVLRIDGAIIFAAFIMGASVYHIMPAVMPIHRGLNGEPDAYAGRFVGVFGLPISICIVVAIMIFLPWFDPDDVILPTHYDLVLVVVPSVIFAIYAWVLLASLGIKVLAIVPVAESILFYSVGALLQKVERNRWVGIKFSWVVSSESVWKKTPRVTGLLFKLFAILALAGLFYPHYELYFGTVAIIVTPLFGIMYLYVIYKKEQRGH